MSSLTKLTQLYDVVATHASPHSEWRRVAQKAWSEICPKTPLFPVETKYGAKSFVPVLGILRILRTL